MKYLMCMVFIMLMVMSCAKSGLEEKRTDNPDFKVTFLFQVDGVKVYRFDDAGHYHYIGVGRDNYIDQTMTEGKNSLRVEKVQTVYK